MNLVIWFVSLICGNVASSMTHPMPPRPQASDGLKVLPGLQIPENPKDFRWEVAHKKQNADSINVLTIDSAGKSQVVGSVAEGTILELTHAKAIGKTIYYQIPASQVQFNSTSKGSITSEYWVSGHHIRARSKQ